MPVYATCCCGDEQVPCVGAKPGEDCSPFAIVLEGVVQVNMTGDYSHTIGSNRVCGECDPPYEYENSEEFHTITYTDACSIRFKCVLTRTGGTLYQLSGSYPPELRGSGQLFFQDTKGTNVNRGSCTNCFNQTQDFESELSLTTAPQDDISLINFTARRESQYLECVPCLTDVAGPGCYEIIRVGGTIGIPCEAFASYKNLKTITDIPGCIEQPLGNAQYPYEENEEFQEVSIDCTVESYAKIADEQAAVDACPLPSSARPFTLIRVPRFPRGPRDPDDPCSPCDYVCECGGIERNEQFKMPGVGPNFTGGVFGLDVPYPDLTETIVVERNFAFPIPICDAHYRQNGVGTTTQSNNSLNLSCDGEEESCFNSPDEGEYCAAPAECGPKGMYSPPNTVRSINASVNSSTGASLSIERHEAFYDPNDLASWPNV